MEALAYEIWSVMRSPYPDRPPIEFLAHHVPFASRHAAQSFVDDALARHPWLFDRYLAQRWEVRRATT